MKIVILLVGLVISTGLSAQYEKTFSAIGEKSFFKEEKIIVNTVMSDTSLVDNKKIVTPYMFLIKGQAGAIEYVYAKPKELTDSSCGYFNIASSKFSLKGKYENDFACDIDVYSLKMFSGTFRSKRYILLTGINNGSGSSTTSIICLLFDITNPKKIKFYPLWSKYGSEFCFQDFNNDGVLDFLKVKQLKDMTDYKILKLELMTLKGSEFMPYKPKDKYIIGEYRDGQFKVTSKKGW